MDPCESCFTAILSKRDNIGYSLSNTHSREIRGIVAARTYDASLGKVKNMDVCAHEEWKCGKSNEVLRCLIL